MITTGIYCRPGCGARPRAENVRTFESAAAAEAAGFRACLRCRPYRLAGSVPWTAPELVCRAVRLIIDGALDDGGEADLGGRLGLSARHLRRLFHEHLGMTPDQLARSRRAHFARRLLDDTDLAIADVAFASGFGSLRQFNRTMLEVFRANPQQLRQRRRRADRLATDGGVLIRLPFALDDWTAMLDSLAAQAIPGVESVDAGAGIYRRTIMVDGGPGVLQVHPGGGPDHLLLRAHLPYWEGLIHVVERVRRLLALDIGPARPGAWGPFEAGVRAIVGQPKLLGRLVSAHGLAIPGLTQGLTHAFPSAETLAAAPAVDLPFDLRATVRAFAESTVEGRIRLDGSATVDSLLASLTAIPGFSHAAAHTLALQLGPA